MLAEIITIGDEILIGQIIDTNSVFIAKELNKIGVQVYQITSVQDQRKHILNALEDAKNRVDIVLLTGGLGPTKDDITKKTFLEYFQDTLVENPIVLQNIKDIFSKYLQRAPLPSNLEQAMVPSKAIVLENPIGTAPGMWMEKQDTVFVSMPGVPIEMRALITNHVLPRIKKQFDRPFIYHKTLLTYGKGESEIQDIIRPWEDRLPSNIKLAYLPSLGRVRLRLSSSSRDEYTLKEQVDAQMSTLNGLLKDISIGFEDQTSIQDQISTKLQHQQRFLSVVESCTGGAIAGEITILQGASSYFKGGMVAYATHIKTDVLGVNPTLIEKHSVVSQAVAQAMALKSNTVFGSQYAIATTGVAGPKTTDSSASVGTVCIAIASPRGVFSEEFNFGNSRERVIKKATNKAFEMLLKEISKN
ncbi:CinA family nicotinamide mononucleotide deamidase-related protein [Flavobacteriaceae bacterium]|nr:CinA family nicotinamide mononucleotide deamidase-related protein [Flavobacteriaceae bacterium]